MPTTTYCIRIRGHLPPDWADRFCGLRLTTEGGGETVLCGPLPDQAALHGVLHQLSRLGLALVSINPIPAD